MKKARVALLVVLVSALSFGQQSKSKPKSKRHLPAQLETVRTDQIFGFTPVSAAKEIVVEAQFKAIPSPAQAEMWHKWLTAEPHPSGSERNNLLAREIADIWKAQGMEDVVIHRYDVLQSSPREVSLEMVTPKRYKAGLREET